MSGSTSVPRPSFGPNGFIAPAESAILTGVFADMTAAFGGGLNQQLASPQGQWASSQTAIIGAGNNLFLYYSNQVDPNFAEGRMQDAIGRIYFLSRLPSLPTVVQALCRGLVGLEIPTGALAQATDGNLYICTGGDAIGADGTVTLAFACAVDGPIACPAGSLNEIYQALPGWDSILNAADGVIGQNTESRGQYEQRRAQSVAQNALGTLPAIQGKLLNVADVIDAYTTDNVTGADVVLDGVTVPAHSLYICVAGGALADVAQAIWQKKAPGCGYSGGTTRTVLDTSNGYSPPYPSYTVTWQTAATQTVVALVKIANSTQVPSTALASIQAAMLLAFAGGDGGPRARIGSTLYASRFYGGIALLGPWAQIVSIKLGSSATPAASFTASIAVDQLSVTAVASGTLAVGQTILGAGLPDGVRITALGTGGGGTGTYTVSNTLTIASEAMTAILPTADDIDVGVAHVPGLSAANISLQLV